MIDYIKINNFKCFTDIDIPLNRLAVMAGANGNGKSTSIQALLFLRKTIEQCCPKTTKGNYAITEENINAQVTLNAGYLLNIGNSGHVTNRNLGESEFSLGVFNEVEEVSVTYFAEIAGSSLAVNAETITGLETKDFPILKKEFYYLNAERIGPRISQSMQSSEYPHAGYQGENTAHIIAAYDYSFEVEGIRRHHTLKLNRLLSQQVNSWLSELMPNVKVVATESNETLTAQLKVENYYTKGDPTIATNIGFGISYVLPIIVNGLIAAKGSYFIIENPEAHLHPSAQSKIGRFLAMVANAGVNVIVETHSDHVINGLQVAVAKKELAANLVTINFFNQSVSNQPEVESITLNEKGELSKWPKGFFDQTQIDFAELFKARKS